MSDNVPLVPSVPLSLKARENASRSLKRIFDQISESVSDQKPSVLNYLDGVNKLPEKHSSDCPKQQSQELSAGLRQQGGTRDFLSLQSYGAESYVDEEVLFEGNAKASLQCAAGTKFSPMPFSKEEPKEIRRFGSNGRAGSSADNGRFNSQEPPLGRLSSNKQDHEAAADQLKEPSGLAFPRAAFTQEEGNRRALGCTASPSSSLMAHQQGDFASYPEICGNGFLGISHAASMPSSSSAARKQPTGQMTIFYSGIVNVYDDVPAEKAHAIMLLAGSGNPRASYLLGSTPSTAVPSSGTAATPVAVSTAKNVAPVTSGVPFTSSMGPSSSADLPTFQAPVKQVVQRSHAELPFARKVSLARFLERRRDRVQSKGTQNTVDSVPEPEVKRVCSRSTSPSPAGISR